MYAHIKRGRRGGRAPWRFRRIRTPEVGGGDLLLLIVEGAIFPPDTLGLGPDMSAAASLLLGGASGIP